MVKKDHTWRDRIGLRGVAPLEQLGEAVCAAFGRHPRRAARLTAMGAALVVFSAPAAAQDFCESNPGELAGLAVNTVLAVVVTAIILGIVGGAALRSLGLRSIGNALVGGAAVGILVLVAGMWGADSALAFVPGVSMDSACGGLGN